jgi:hypothetical protein
MYITNPEVVSEDKIYWCNGVISEWLIFQKHLPLLSKKGRCFGFAKTEKLAEALKDLPFWLKIAKKF